MAHRCPKYGAIERFSEDIDLAFHRKDFGFDEEAFKSEGNKARDRRIENLTENCTQYIAGTLRPALEKTYDSKLEPKAWSITTDPHDSLTLLFNYPPSLESAEYTSLTYIKPAVRLEIGARSDHDPASNKQITPYAAERFPDYFTHPATSVHVLSGERTFWEKLTILHAEYYRPDTTIPGPRLSRHYYDAVKLYQSDIGKTAIQNTALLQTVANHKALYFRSARARYELAKPGSLRLVPGDTLNKWLAKDYKAMEEMIFGEVLSFDKIIQTLKEMEAIINT